MTEWGAGNHPPLQLLSTFVLGRLPPEEATPIEEHLLNCEWCTAQLDDLTPDDALVRQLRALPPTCLPAQMPPPSMHIGRYDLHEEIGRGGMGVVYRAFDTGLKRFVALKLIPTSGNAGCERKLRLQREAEITAALGHPGVVQIHEIGDFDGGVYLALELLRPGGLEPLVGTDPRAPAWSAALVRQLAETVAHAHENGLLHRDLKLDNLLLAEPATGTGAAPTDAPLPPLDPPPRVKIADFGLAIRFGEDSGLTHDGMMLGTPDYMAPEQIPGSGLVVGPATDIHALGVILYRLLTGCLPFQGADIHTQLCALRELAPAPPSRLVPGIPVDLEAICLKCLAKDPEDRYRSATELEIDLGRFLRDEPVRVKRPPWTRRVMHWARRRPTLAATWAVCALFYLLHLFNVFVLSDTGKGENFHLALTLLIPGVAAQAWVAQACMEHPRWRALGEFLYLLLAPLAAPVMLMFDQGPASAPVGVYLVAIAGSALIRAHPAAVWTETALCLGSYGLLTLFTWRYSPQHLVSAEHAMAMVLAMFCVGLVMHLLLRRMSTAWPD